MLQELFGHPIVFILLLIPSKLFSINIRTACDLLNLPRECHCQRTRNMPMFSLNDTRLRCRQLTDITTNHRWSSVFYNHLTLETFYENLTVHQFAFSNIVARSIRFNTQYLILQDHTFDNGYIGQVVITSSDRYGRINFDPDGQIFYGATITNLYFKFIDFERPINEFSFSNSKIYSLIIHSSKFYGFTNENGESIYKNFPKLKYDHFLEYDVLPLTNQKKVPLQSINSKEESSSTESEQTIIMNITLMANPVYINIFTIISSVNTTSLTANYFPNNIEYSQTDAIELSSNQIDSIGINTFYHLRQFKGRLILTNNQIKYLNLHAFADLRLLQNLSLAFNLIKNISSIHFRELTNLYELDLSSNQINALNNGTFKYLHNLNILYLNDNPLKFIHPNAFSNLTNLKQIHFHGVDFFHLIDPSYYQWIWSLASLRVIHLLKTDFDLSDVAFCILSNNNQTLSHLSHQHLCSCNIHYLSYNYSFSISNDFKFHQNYLRLTPLCYDNQTETILKQQKDDNDLIFKDLEDKCDYKLMFLDCDAMITTTLDMTNLSDIETQTTYTVDNLTSHTTDISTPMSSIRTSTKKLPTDMGLNNIKKLFIVLGTLLAITIGAIALVLFWYRFKAILKQKKEKKSFIEQQRHFNSPDLHNQNSTGIQYTSSDTLNSVRSARLSGSKSRSETYVEPTTIQTLSIYKNIEAIDGDPIENFIDDESLNQDSKDDLSREIPTITHF